MASGDRPFRSGGEKIFLSWRSRKGGSLREFHQTKLNAMRRKIGTQKKLILKSLYIVIYRYGNCFSTLQDCRQKSKEVEEEERKCEGDFGEGSGRRWRRVKMICVDCSPPPPSFRLLFTLPLENRPFPFFSGVRRRDVATSSLSRLSKRGEERSLPPKKCFRKREGEHIFFDDGTIFHPLPPRPPSHLQAIRLSFQFAPLTTSSSGAGKGY